jgi:dTDP-4-dehydrorhamnose 3,5-epimerase
MKFEESHIPGVYLIEPELLGDDRSFFARSFCQKEFAQHGLEPTYVQCNLSYNAEKGTTRGMHFQFSPHEEVKLVRCTRGAVFDVAVDFREDSPTYLQWYGAELSDSNRHMLYIPRGFAHGYQTLSADAELFYQVSEFYSPGFEGGLRWNDPDIGIEWPISEVESVIISDKDSKWPLLSQR